MSHYTELNCGPFLLFASTLTLLWATIVAQNKPSAACCPQVNSLKKKLFNSIFFTFVLWCLPICALKLAN